MVNRKRSRIGNASAPLRFFRRQRLELADRLLKRGANHRLADLSEASAHRVTTRHTTE